MPRAESARQAGAGAWRRARQEALAVLFDLGLGERVEIVHHRWPGGAGAPVGGGEAIYLPRRSSAPPPRPFNPLNHLCRRQ